MYEKNAKREKFDLVLFLAQVLFCFVGEENGIDICDSYGWLYSFLVKSLE